MAETLSTSTATIAFSPSSLHCNERNFKASTLCEAFAALSRVVVWATLDVPP